MFYFFCHCFVIADKLGKYRGDFDAAVYTPELGQVKPVTVVMGV